MAAKNTVKVDEVDEMFASVQEDGASQTDDPFAGMDDLLDTVVEDDSEGWVPTEKGEGLVGVVVKVSETKSDFPTAGKDPMCPTLTIEGVALDVQGGKTPGKYRVIGYGTVLRRELEDQDPQVGDKIALKYFGEKTVKNGAFAGKPFKHYGVVVLRK